MIFIQVKITPLTSNVKKLTLFLFFFILIFELSSQSNHEIQISFNSMENKFVVKHSITIEKSYLKGDNNLYVYDWNNSYSSYDTPLSKKLYSEYDSSLLKPKSSLIGRTDIKEIKINNKVVSWIRLDESVDVLKLFLEDKSQEKELEIFAYYDIYLPKYSITNNGNYKNKFYYLKNSILRIVPFYNDNSTKFSNLNLDDQFVYNSNFKISIEKNKNFNIITNADYKDSNNLYDNFHLYNSKDLQIVFDSDNYFKSNDFSNYLIFSDSDNIKINNNDVLERINDFINSKFKTPLKKVVINKEDFNNYSIYPYSEVPSFISPIDNEILKELNIVKLLISKNLYQSINFNKRTNYWFFSGIEIFYLNEYISNHYNDLKLLGKYSNFFLLKKHNIANYSFLDQYKIINQFVSSRNIEQKLSLSSDKLTRFNYKLNTPYLSYFNLKYLKSFIGNDSFKNSLEKIFNSSFKNEKSIEDILKTNTKKNITWFFEDLLETNEAFDFKIDKIGSNRYSLKNSFTFINKIPVPIKKQLIDYDSIHWVVFNNKYEDSIGFKTQNIVVNPNFILNENNYKNNHLYKNDLNKLKLTLFSDVESYKTNQIFYRPVVSYNLYDGILPGLTLTNQSPLKKNLTYFISPQFSSKSKSISGLTSLNYRDIVNKTNTINYFMSISKFNYEDDFNYIRISPSILYSIKDEDLRSNFRKYFVLRHININKEIENNKNDKYGITNFSFINSNPGAKNSYSFIYDFQINNNFIKNSITFSYRNYFNEFRQFNFRLFVGKFLKNNTINNNYDFKIHSSNDYLFSNNLIGRSESEGFYSQQYVKYEGAFKSKIKQQSVDDFIFVASSGITLWKWFEAYLDYGLFKEKKKKLSTGYDFGLRLNIIENYLELYFPLINSDEIALKSNNYINNIRFTLSLDPENLSNLFTRRWF